MTNLIYQKRYRGFLTEPMKVIRVGEVIAIFVEEGEFKVLHGEDQNSLCSGELLYLNLFSVQKRRGSTIETTVEGVGSILCAQYDGSKPPFGRLLSRFPGRRLIADEVVQCHTHLGFLTNALRSELQLADVGCEDISRHIFEALYLAVLRDWVLQQFGASAFTTPEDPNIDKAITALQKDIGRNWTNHDLAMSAGLSRAAFARRFKVATNTSPAEFLKKSRMHVAAKLLSDTLSVQNVSEQVGYLSESAFSRAFTSYFGIAPSRYRKQ